mmetsp:Transcript_80023/g.138904  ORF Transcript_80023/g.138904 Transcript_80023/m.138904 type:complete len:107 (-) Transcript_80023:680-1000(-)
MAGTTRNRSRRRTLRTQALQILQQCDYSVGGPPPCLCKKQIPGSICLQSDGSYGTRAALKFISIIELDPGSSYQGSHRFRVPEEGGIGTVLQQRYAGQESQSSDYF